MTSTITDTASIPPITHREATGLSHHQYEAMATMLETLDERDWDRPTDCEGWTVRDLAGHVLGSMRAAASMREMLRQQKEINRRVKADGGNEVDHMTALQIEWTAAVSPDELVAECRRLIRPAARGRSRTPLPMRRFVKFDVEMGAIAEKWTLGYLVDVILTRDILMHRIDLSRATRADLDVDTEPDRRVVSDIVAEWGRRHGRSFELVLTGPAGGAFAAGHRDTDADAIELDAVEFCRTLSGRAPGTGLLATEVPF